MRRMASEQATVSTFTPGPRELRPAPVHPRRSPAARMAMIHGAWFMAAGAWPVLHLESFAKVTGLKLEGWLTKGVGTCFFGIGAALFSAGSRRRAPVELRALGAGLGLAFAWMDFYYAGIRRRIPPAYLLNGAAQLAFAAGWAGAEIVETNKARRQPEAAFA